MQVLVDALVDRKVDAPLDILRAEAWQPLGQRGDVVTQRLEALLVALSELPGRQRGGLAHEYVTLEEFEKW